jgi:hypothetical protein
MIQIQTNEGIPLIVSFGKPGLTLTPTIKVLPNTVAPVASPKPVVDYGDGDYGYVFQGQPVAGTYLVTLTPSDATVPPIKVVISVGGETASGFIAGNAPGDRNGLATTTGILSPSNLPDLVAGAMAAIGYQPIPPASE